ncbi:AI-2E family transporter [Capsulimonas corticalis]|uniref:AI-2E family transporter n=1 Tax=Capsulimonas corticalis TaxID=2219043 RepID=A0A402D2T9_9BACT|nr:AI-2E family transporter [Capsulimonas corticalis]BDI28455.1 AI-2E family transporter [Capsulimonas corticalis]
MIPPAPPSFDQKKVVSLFTILAYLGAIGVVLWLLYDLRTLIPPFLVATIFAMTLIPEVDRMERRGYRRGLAIGIIYVLFLGICGLIARSLNQLASGQMTQLLNLLPDKVLHGTPQQVAEYASAWMKLHHVPEVMRPPVINQAKHLPELIGQGMGWLSANLPLWAENLVWVVIVPIMTFFLLLDFHKILGKLLILAPRERREDILTVVTEIIAVFGNYVRGMMLVMLLDITVIYIVLRVAGLSDYALSLAVTAGILYTIPYFGAVVSTIMIGGVALVSHGATAALIVTAVMILIHQVVFDNIVAPRIIGGSVNLHPLLTLGALMAGGTLMGIPGTLLAVPIAAALQVVLVHIFPQLKADVVSIRRAERVVKASISTETEQNKPASRKSGDGEAMIQEEKDAKSDAQEPPSILPQT